MARLLCPDPNVPDVRSVRKCPPTPPGLPSGVRNIHKCPATISSVPNRVPREKTLSGVCHPSIETSPGTQLIEHQAGDQRWLQITWNGDLLLGRCHADCVFQHNIVEFALVKRLNNKSKVMIGIYIVFVWKLFKIDQITQIKQKLNFHQCTMCCL